MLDFPWILDVPWTMCGFASFPLLGFILVIKVKHFDFENH